MYLCAIVRNKFILFFKWKPILATFSYMYVFISWPSTSLNTFLYQEPKTKRERIIRVCMPGFQCRNVYEITRERETNRKTNSITVRKMAVKKGNNKTYSNKKGFKNYWYVPITNVFCVCVCHFPIVTASQNTKTTTIVCNNKRNN